jgi:PAS domain S-box-containing protein
MQQKLRILLLEDSVRDADLLERELRNGGVSFNLRRVDEPRAFIAQLIEFTPDVIIADYKLPAFDGLEALELVRKRSAELPFILVSGYIGEERAIEALRLGATDVILKDRLGRLAPGVQRAMREVRERAEHQRLQERFRLVVEAAPSAMVMTGAAGKIEMVNGQTERMFDYSREHLIGRQIEMLIPERFHANHPGLRAGFFAKPHARAMDAVHDLFGRRRDGSEFPVEIALNPIEIEDGTVVLSVIMDITARRRIEREKEQQRHELTRSNAELESFAYIASHDLKAPLRAISHLAEWIEEDIAATASPETSDNLRLLRGRVTRLQGLLDGLLAYSRVGRTSGDAEDIDIAEMVSDVRALLASPPGFVVVCEEPMPSIHTHSVPLRGVLENLIANAIKHHDRPEGHVTVSMRLKDGVAEFRVGDDGPGIAPRFHERIFTIFQTLTSRDEVESSGIGLAIVKKRVENHGGRVWVESAPPVRGSTFVFTWKDTKE